MPSLPISFALAFAALTPCLWDRDTLAIEAEGAPGLVEVIMGRFDRFPDRYYETRLDRVTLEIEGGETELALFDDAAVACDRLGRSGDAIKWMAAKKARLDNLKAPAPHHEYTYLANLGTFHAHRWLRAEAPARDPADLERARDLIRLAIKENPDAHFGRERYQLLAIEHLIDPMKPSSEKEPATLFPLMFARREALPGRDGQEPLNYDDAAEGLAGLIYLGDAWESALIWGTLQKVLLNRRDAYLARLAANRVIELFHQDQASFPGFDLARYATLTSSTLESEDRDKVDSWYSRAQPTVTLWRASRQSYLEERIDRGEHPDTHPNFWADWRDEHPLPSLDGTLPGAALGQSFKLLQKLAILCLVVFLVIRFRRWRRREKVALALYP